MEAQPLKQNRRLELLFSELLKEFQREELLELNQVSGRRPDPQALEQAKAELEQARDRFQRAVRYQRSHHAGLFGRWLDDSMRQAEAWREVFAREEERLQVHWREKGWYDEFRQQGVAVHSYADFKRKCEDLVQQWHEVGQGLRDNPDLELLSSVSFMAKALR